jgi:hypothetical protein
VFTTEESLRDLMNVDPRLREAHDVLAWEWAPGSPPPTLVSSDLARSLIAITGTLKDAEIQAVFACVERVLSTGDDAAKDVVTTGFLEVLVAANDRQNNDAARLMHFLGPQATAYCAAWRART